MSIGSAYPEDGDKVMDIRGRDLVTGLPKNQPVTVREINQAMSERLHQF